MFRPTALIPVAADLPRECFDYTKRMKRTSVLILLLLAMLWQSVDLVRAGATPDRLADLQHAMLHWQDEGHHHHDDGGLHLDDSGDAVGHVMADNVNASAMLPHVSPQVPDFDGGDLRVREPRAGPSPYLDGLMRPPRLTA